MKKTLDVNMDGAIQLTAKLEKLHRSAFPSAVRNTLNDAALETKRLIPKVAKQKFITRRKTLFKMITGARKATGFNVNTMYSSVGVLSGLSNKSKLADGLSEHEKGGTITGRKLIALNTARVSNNRSKKIKRKYRFDKIKIAKKGTKTGGTTNFILLKKGGKGTVFERKRLKNKTKLVPVFHFRNTRKSKVKKTPFIGTSSKLIAKRLPKYYQDNARYQFNKVWK